MSTFLVSMNVYYRLIIETLSSEERTKTKDDCDGQRNPSLNWPGSYPISIAKDLSSYKHRKLTNWLDDHSARPLHNAFMS